MKWKNEEINFLNENYNKLGRAECSKILCRSIDSVATKIRDGKLNLISKEVWSDNDLKFLNDNYVKYGVDYCVEKLKVNRRRIISKANSLGLKTNVIIKSESKNKPKVNYELFSTEFTKESVYILGLLWADGHVRQDKKTISISCVQSDIEEVIPTFLKTGKWLISNPIKKYFKGNEVKTQIKISTTTWGLFKILKKYNYLTKSNDCPIEMINKIPNEYRKYWYRGFLDGDGCIKLGKKYGSEIVFAGTKDDKWLFMIDLCDNLSIDYKIIRKTINNGGYSHFRVNKKVSVLKLGDYLYSNYDNIGFNRKYKKYLDVINRINN